MIETHQVTVDAPNTVLPKLQLNPYKKRRLLVIGAIALQATSVFALAVQPAVTMVRGRTVTFSASPVDPWDAFRGDYVNLAYRFSSNVPLSEHLNDGTPIYVVLAQDAKGKWLPVRASHLPMRPNPQEVMLKGTSMYSDGKTTSVKYGIERVFVGEGSGRNLGSDSPLSVDVAITESGDNVVKEVRSNQLTLFKFHWL